MNDIILTRNTVGDSTTYKMADVEVSEKQYLAAYHSASKIEMLGTKGSIVKRVRSSIVVCRAHGVPANLIIQPPKMI